MADDTNYVHLPPGGRSSKLHGLELYVANQLAGQVTYVPEDDGELQVSNVEVFDGWGGQGRGTHLILELLNLYPNKVLTGTSFSDEGQGLRRKLLDEHGVVMHTIHCFNNRTFHDCD